MAGEFQLAFVCFLLLHSMSSFDYWKLFVGSFCSARRLVVGPLSFEDKTKTNISTGNIFETLMNCRRIQKHMQTKKGILKVVYKKLLATTHKKCMNTRSKVENLELGLDKKQNFTIKPNGRKRYYM